MAGNLPSILMFRQYLSGTTIVARGALHINISINSGKREEGEEPVGKHQI